MALSTPYVMAEPKPGKKLGVAVVGAGDAFNAGLAVGLREGRPMLEAIALGVTAASLSTQRRETIESACRVVTDLLHLAVRRHAIINPTAYHRAVGSS